MIDQASGRVWAVGLYDSSEASYTPADFKSFYDLSLTCFARLGVVPTGIAVNAPGFSSKVVKFGGKATTRLFEGKFQDVTLIDFRTHPEGPNAPFTHDHPDFGFSYLDHKGGNLSLIVGERFAPFGGDVFDEIVSDFCSMRDWSFGFAFTDTPESQPELHVIGGDTGRLSPEEYAALLAWYNAPREDRLTRLRGAYPVMLLSDHQLAQPYSENLTLKDYIQKREDQPLKKTGSLWRWDIPTHDLDKVATDLKKARLIAGL